MAAYSASIPIYQVANGTPAADFLAGQSNAPKRKERASRYVEQILNSRE